MGCPRPNTSRSDPYDIGELAEPLRSRIWTAVLMAPGHGLVLVSGYRDAGRQWDIRAERVGAANACNPAVKAHPATAVPYASDHQRRTAADMGGSALGWFIDHREALGLALTVPSENWHDSADRRDVRTGRVHNRPTIPIIPFGVIPPGYTPTPGRGGTGNATPDHQSEEDELMAASDDINAHTDTVVRQAVIDLQASMNLHAIADAQVVRDAANGTVVFVDTLLKNATGETKAALEAWRADLTKVAAGHDVMATG